jgi:hypothetical protein
MTFLYDQPCLDTRDLIMGHPCAPWWFLYGIADHPSRCYLPSVSGAYVVYKDHRPIYVGSSANIRRRFSTYRSSRRWSGLDVKVRYLPRNWLDLERRLIRRLNPPCNIVRNVPRRVRGRYWSDHDIVNPPARGD